MKIIETNGISYIEPVSGATREWYFGIDYEHGDLYEAEEIYKEGYPINGRNLYLVNYPNGVVYVPVPKKSGCYCEKPIYFEEKIYILNLDFPRGLIQNFQFDCENHETKIHVELQLSSVKDCYNLSLQISPLTLTRQCVGTNEFEIVWPERIKFKMDDHDSFYLRDGDKLFFSRWYEEGEGVDYRYWEKTVVKNLSGQVMETLDGTVYSMPNGELWIIK